VVVAKKEFDNNASAAKVSIQLVAMFLMGQAGVLMTIERYWLALAFAIAAGILVFLREFVVKRLQ
jgi:hypothetical protein